MSGSNSPPDDINFNDLNSSASQSTEQTNGASKSPNGTSQVAKAKRIACIICRKRKLKCDGARPSCATCSRLSHNCAYDEVRRKSGPKRGYVKELEAKLSSLLRQRIWIWSARTDHVDNLDTLWAQVQADKSDPQRQQLPSISQSGYVPGDPNSTMGDQDMMTGFAGATSTPLVGGGRQMPTLTVTSSEGNNTGPDFPWEMVGLGLEEALPPPDLIEEM